MVIRVFNICSNMLYLVLEGYNCEVWLVSALIFMEDKV